MKKTIISLLLGITAGTALAQKLSPATEVYLMQRSRRGKESQPPTRRRRRRQTTR